MILAAGGAGAAVALGSATAGAAGGAWGGLGMGGSEGARCRAAGKCRRRRGGQGVSAARARKRELIAAAHSTIVVAAVFEAFREHVDDEFYAKLKVPEGENPFVRDPLTPEASNAISRTLYTSEVPTPSGACGFSENIDLVSAYQVNLIKGLDGYADTFRTAEGPRIDRASVILEARERYVSHYLRLAAKVPEFAIWSQLGEHAATLAAAETGEQVAAAEAGGEDLVVSANWQWKRVAAVPGLAGYLPGPAPRG